jgi:ABC-type Na+ efflux pump permease subunit
LVAFVVSFTVAGSLALGIALAYTAFLALLHAFAENSRKPQPTLVLVPTQNQVSGD